MRKYIILFLLWGVFGNAQYNLFARQNFSEISSGYDADAQAFITAAGLTDNTQKDAINTLVLSLKSNLLWDKMKAIYPFIGGTAFAHKWNLKDPRDLDAAFRLTYSGTITHNLNGIQPTIGAAISTNLVPGSALTVNDTSLGVYSKTDGNTGGADIGGQDSDPQRMTVYIKLGGTLYADLYNPTSARVTFSMASTSALGFFVANRTSSTVLNCWKNSTKLNTNTTLNTSILPASGVIYIGRDPSFQSNRLYAFAFIATGMTDVEVSGLYTSIQAYQTTLGRHENP